MIEFLTGGCVGVMVGFFLACFLASAKKMTEAEAEQFYAEKREARIRALLTGGRDLQ